MSTDPARIAALRAELAARHLDGFVVPLTDEHLSEYVGDYAQRLGWLTGFGGSAGTAAVLAGRAAIFVDGRYTLQVREQVDGALFAPLGVPEHSVAGWLAAEAPVGARIGYDPWLHTAGWVGATQGALAAKGAALVAVADNPVDAVWADRPARPTAPIVPHDEALAGHSGADKRQAIAEALAAAQADAVVLTALDSIAWAFNLRGGDVAHTPVGLAFALVHADGTADLFAAPAKVTDAALRHLGNGVRVADIAGFPAALEGLGGRTVAVDPAATVAAVAAALERGGARIVALRDPTVLPRAVKTDAELAGHRAAQERDGAAMVRFLHWLSIKAPKGQMTELSAAAKLRAFREATGQLLDLSFETISAAGPNGASPHYRVTEESDRRIAPDMLYLIDSGGQYRDGTTDITRTVAVGTPTAEMRRRFTLVLKGHIAIARAVFPAGTRGAQLDTLARAALWAEGLDYAHGTGHGVGAYLSVHEGPQRIAPVGSAQAGGDEPLRAGMILSNEPGYYKAGEYGIRIENLVAVEIRAVAGAERPCLGFETLSFVPIDRALIATELLDVSERAWLDDYHARTWALIGPRVEGAAADWLQKACRPL
ncbi:MAG: aminopeptidase family protein P [Sphingomonas fennica]